MLSVESTCNQVNQFGGYTGMNPADFVSLLHNIAHEVGLDLKRILIGSDHLGPYPWRSEPSEDAMEKACQLARASVLAGYTKIHLDASMACGGDPRMPDDDTVAQRAAQLCSVAEHASQERSDLPTPLYVVGTEVPVPGGEQSNAQRPQPTAVGHVDRTLESFGKAFRERGLQEAWQRVIGLVVHSGAEFSDSQVFDYDPLLANGLRDHLPQSPSLVYEAHSTDYQTSVGLGRMVEDHFAILKVGPWLTFAYREAVFALSAIEHDWLGGRRGVQLSSVRQALEAAMLQNPTYWRDYAAGQGSFSREFGFSDRCRYYWPDSTVQAEVKLLLSNLSENDIPLTLVSQYFPGQYNAIRAEKQHRLPERLIEQHIGKVLTIYSNACCDSGLGV